MSNSTQTPYTVVDLFSGGGGMSFGFHAHPMFRITGAVDAQLGKPSTKAGSLDCNSSYALNMGIKPINANLGTTEPELLRELLGTDTADVLSACPPCTGFSRTNANNHLVDDERNSLVPRVALFAEALSPSVIVMENARELLNGNFRTHFEHLRNRLDKLGYEVLSGTHFLNSFGLPQIRERALVIAAKRPLTPHSLEELWNGYSVDPGATSVRRAIAHLPSIKDGEAHSLDPNHAAPKFASPTSRARIQNIPPNGGSWRDLIALGEEGQRLLTPAMKRLVERNRLGSFPDVYGRMSWDKPAPTIKRECGHVGNGRYAHPEEDRLCSLREMATLNGFPSHYQFGGMSLANKYRHIGDAVPPLISFQIASAVSWTLTGARPQISDIVLPNTSLQTSDIRSIAENGAAA